jgi:hypothetical protein
MEKEIKERMRKAIVLAAEILGGYHGEKYHTLRCVLVPKIYDELKEAEKKSAGV